jgi:hypothetical protein
MLDRGMLDTVRVMDEIPLDFSFLWSTLDNRVRLSWDGNTAEYELGEALGMCEECDRQREFELEASRPALPPDNSLWAVMGGEGESLHVVMVSSNRRYAERMSLNATEDENLTVLEFPMKETKPSEATPVWIVSVGEGARYRIVDMALDHKQAVKIATSVRGVLAKYTCVPGPLEPRSAVLYKYFVVLEEDYEGDDEIFFVDSFRREARLHDGQQIQPFITRRRRYNRSLPYRVEVASPDRHQGGEIANRLMDSINIESLEYNVDYTVVHTDNGWEIDPCLLVAANVE